MLRTPPPWRRCPGQTVCRWAQPSSGAALVTHKNKDDVRKTWKFRSTTRRYAAQPSHVFLLTFFIETVPQDCFTTPGIFITNQSRRSSISMKFWSARVLAKYSNFNSNYFKLLPPNHRPRWNVEQNPGN